MDTLKFDDYGDLVDRIVDEYDYFNKKSTDYNSVSVLAKYEDARKVIWHLITEYRYSINSIQIADPMVNRYDDEYIISLFDDEIWCEPALRDTGYIYTEEDACFVFSDCNSALLSKIHSKVTYEVSVEDTVGCDDCEECPCSSYEKYKINGHSVSKEEYEKKASEYEDRVREHMDNLLDDYNEYIDEIIRW